MLDIRVFASHHEGMSHTDRDSQNRITGVCYEH